MAATVCCDFLCRVLERVHFTHPCMHAVKVQTHSVIQHCIVVNVRTCIYMRKRPFLHIETLSWPPWFFIPCSTFLYLCFFTQWRYKHTSSCYTTYSWGYTRAYKYTHLLWEEGPYVISWPPRSFILRTFTTSWYSSSYAYSHMPGRYKHPFGGSAPFYI